MDVNFCNNFWGRKIYIFFHCIKKYISSITFFTLRYETWFLRTLHSTSQVEHSQEVFMLLK